MAKVVGLEDIKSDGELQGLPFTLLSLLLGWWGIPWGPIYTIQSLWVNLKGGRDVTQEIMPSMRHVTTIPH